MFGTSSLADGDAIVSFVPLGGMSFTECSGSIGEIQLHISAGGSDLNCNGIADWVEIEFGYATDEDGDWRPDGWEGAGWPCNPCAGDVHQDGVIGVEDLLIVIPQWGTPGSGGDVDGDGDVGVDDLLIVVDTWGPC